MSGETELTSCDVYIAATSVTLNGNALDTSQPVVRFHALLGPPTRVVPAGPPAPAGHRNVHIHYYDRLGLTLNEHHHTYRIEAVTLVLNTDEAIHPTREPFSGVLEIGGVRVAPGDPESKLAASNLRWVSSLRGVWSAEVLSAPTKGHRIDISVETIGRKQPSGRRSKKRELVAVSLSLEHDPFQKP